MDDQVASNAADVSNLKLQDEDDFDVNDGLDYDSFEEDGGERPAERWAPLGAAAVSPSPSPYEPRYGLTNKQVCVYEYEAGD